MCPIYYTHDDDMKKINLIAIPMIAIVCGFLVWWYGDTQLLTRKTNELARSLSLEAGDRKVTRISKNKNLSALLARDLSCSIKLDDYQSHYNYSQLVEAHLHIGLTYGFCSVQISELNIISIANETANILADFIISTRNNDESENSKNVSVNLVWSKDEIGNWQIRKIKLRSP